MSEATKPKSLSAKLAEVMGAIQSVGKDGENTFHHYDYATESAIVTAVRGHLAERGVILIPSIEQCDQAGTLTTLVFKFTFVDGETGEVHEARWIGTGDDKGDKGAYKAMTGAVKYFLLKTFLIPTHDDPEGDTGTDKRAKDEPRQARATTVRTNGQGGKGSSVASANGPMNDGQRTAIERLMLDKRGVAPVDIVQTVPDWPHISMAKAGLMIGELQK